MYVGCDKVRTELVDAYALTEQVRLGSTPEVVLSEDTDVFKDCTAICRMQQPRQGQCRRPETARSMDFAVVGPPAAAP
jgi:hypothetical protein